MELSYQEFTEIMRQEVQRLLEAEKKGGTVSVIPVRSQNPYINIGYGPGIDAALSMNGKNILIAGLYLRHKEGETISRLSDMAARALRMPFEGLTWAQVKSQVQLRPIGYEMNQDYLRAVPYKRMGDLCVIYQIVEQDRSYDRCATITAEMMKSLGVSERELHDAAVANTRESRPVLFQPIEEVMREIEDAFGMEPLGEPETVEADKNIRMSILGAQDGKTYGACVVFYPEVLEMLSEKYPEGYFVIPSSVDETIIVSKNILLSREELEQFICKVNATELRPEERLSDKLHEYNPQTKELEESLPSRSRKETEREMDTRKR